MAVYKSNTRISLAARVLLSHLLLIYLLWFPLHLQTHELHTFTQSTQQEDKGIIPVEKESCQICDWWTQQSTVGAFAPADIILNCTAFTYPLPIYDLPYVEASARQSPRAPPALG